MAKGGSQWTTTTTMMSITSYSLGHIPKLTSSAEEVEEEEEEEEVT